MKCRRKTNIDELRGWAADVLQRVLQYEAKSKSFFKNISKFGLSPVNGNMNTEGIASNHNLEPCGEFVMEFCTYRPSHAGSWSGLMIRLIYILLLIYK